MAMNLGFKPMYGVLETGMAMLAGSWVIGATGAVGAKSGGQGLTLSRTGTGAYTLQITGAKGASVGVQSILSVDVRHVDSSDELIFLLTAVDATGVITFLVGDEAGGAVELPNPSIIKACVIVKLSKTA